MSYAIVSIAKIKTMGCAGAHGGHLERTIDTPNADPDLKRFNRREVGSGDLPADIAGRIQELGITPRKNAVLAVDFLMTASPEAFGCQVVEHEGQKAVAGKVEVWRDFERNARQWIEERYGRENLVNSPCTWMRTRRTSMR